MEQKSFVKRFIYVFFVLGFIGYIGISLFPVISNNAEVTQLVKLINKGDNISIDNVLSARPQLVDSYSIPKGDSVFNIAVSSGNLNIVKIFLKHGVNINHRGSSNRAGLHVAVNSNNEQMVSLLLDNGADINISGFRHDNTSLQIAVDRNYLGLAEFLILKGANINSIDMQKETPLMDAVENGDIDMVELLLRHGANKYMVNQAGETAMDIAKKGKEDRLIRILEN
ncbi:MAG: ankyrin repeat domain-containing protein [Candidatus Omnitrophica bacterium]|nr:ankyrin repeat domain-containing protein [Candidatus Omnitrophota bacterium]